MLSKEDYKNYLDQVIQLENKMVYVYKECSGRVEEGFVKKTCLNLSNSEAQHALMLKELKKLFDL